MAVLVVLELRHLIYLSLRQGLQVLEQLVMRLLTYLLGDLELGVLELGVIK